MSEAHQIRCVSKSDRHDPHDRITHIGGINGHGAYWRISVRQAIEGMENGSWKFFVTVDGKTAWVVVANSRYGDKYLKTRNDGEQPDDLLNLPECP